jgi:NAD(P)-dependent dehydrogenase (short-subunit alcohol dehydrogenase family)
MPLPRYTYTGPVNHTIPPDAAKLRNKSIIVTGGANGMGEVTVRELVKHGAFVTIADLSETRGYELEKELNASGNNCVFVKVDVRDWDQQKKMFEIAKARSPQNSVDVVFANAGISRSSGDSLWELDGERKTHGLSLSTC